MEAGDPGSIAAFAGLVGSRNGERFEVSACPRLHISTDVSGSRARLQRRLVVGLRRFVEGRAVEDGTRRVQISTAALHKATMRTW